MLFTAQHVQYFLDVSHELQRLTREAKQWEETISSPSLSSSFYGNLTSKQLQRLLPGFFRVEVLPKPPTQEEQQQLLQKFADSSSSSVPIDPTQPLQTINPNFCCRIQKTTTTTTTTTTSSIDKNNNFNNQTLILQQRLPLNPQSNQLITWETAIQGFSLRQFPTGSYLDWVAFLPGVRRLRSEDQAIPSYWTGTYSDPKQRHRPFIGNPQLFAQQGGFMLSRQQIQLLENDLCVGRFLPPFQEPLFLKDGLWQNNVEFYSGGFQLFGNDEMDAGCNLQRIVDLNPTNFSQHLIYHTTNNKQRSMPRERIVPLDYLFTQLHTAKLHAITAKDHEESLQIQ
jgi:hypothetical protein